MGLAEAGVALVFDVRVMTHTYLHEQKTEWARAKASNPFAGEEE